MIYLINLLTLILTILPIFFALTNTLIFPLTRKQKISIFAFMVLSHMMLSSKPIIATVVMLILSLALITLFQKHFIFNISSALIGYITCVCLNYFILSLAGTLDFTIDFIEGHPEYYLLFCLFFSIIIWFTSRFLGKFLQNLYWDKFSKFILPANSKIYVLLFLELFACVFIYVFNITYGRFAGYPKSIVTFNGLLFLFFFIFTAVIMFFLVRTIRKDTELASKLKEFDNLQEYTSRVENLYMELRIFKHDYINLLSTLNVFIEEKEYDRLEEYFKLHILPTGQNLAKEDSILGRLSHMKLLELKSLLYTKIVCALAQKLNVTVEIPEDISDIPVDSTDLIRIIGIFLDNAIEAATNTDDRILNVFFYQDESNTVIKISNSCAENPDLDHIFELDFSTKSNSRGVGLYTARKILDQYPRILLHTSCEDRLFAQELQILS